MAFPRKQGLYDPAFERDACGLGFVARLDREIPGPADEGCVGRGTEIVAQAFPMIKANLERGVAQRWARDPWARGAFVAFKPGQMTTMMPEIARPEGRVHFAGEHTSSWMTWMEGALQSAERAAREIMAA